MTVRTASVVALALWWSLPARAEAPEPAGIRIACDGIRRIGFGVVVHDFRPSHEGEFLLLTALHVVQGCAEVDAQVVSCSQVTAAAGPVHWSAEHPIEVLVWRDLDLAAIVIPVQDRARLSSRFAAFSLATGPHSDVPGRFDELELIAAGGINVCPMIDAKRRDVFPASKLYQSLDEPDYYKLFGSLAQDTILMSYVSTAGRGTSGGPVIWMTRDPRRVVAINLGGQQNTLQWGVLVDRATLLRTMSALEQEGVARLDADHPQLVVREFEAPHRLLDGDPGATSKLDLALHRNSALAMLSSSTPVDPFGAVGHSLQLGWSHQWFSLPMALLDTSFGTRLIAGGLFGQYRSPVAQDVNDRHQPHEDPLRGSARLPFYGGFGEADAELHLARLLPIHYVVALGLRGGVSHQRYVRDGGNTFVWGPVLSGQAKWQLSDALSGVLQVHVEVQRIPVAATPADCHSQAESCSSQPWTPAWDVWAGLGLGAEWAL